MLVTTCILDESSTCVFNRKLQPDTSKLVHCRHHTAFFYLWPWLHMVIRFANNM